MSHWTRVLWNTVRLRDTTVTPGDAEWRGKLSDMMQPGACHWHRHQASDALSGVTVISLTSTQWQWQHWKCENDSYFVTLQWSFSPVQASQIQNPVLSPISVQQTLRWNKHLSMNIIVWNRFASGGGFSGSSPSPTPAYSPPKSPTAGSPHNTGWERVPQADIRYHH